MWKKILRWIAVIPSTIGGLLIGTILINLIGLIQSWFVGADTESGFVKIITMVFSPFAGGALALYWGVKVAPAYKKIVAMILAALILIIALFVCLYSISEYGLFWSIVSSTATAVGGGYVMYHIFEDGENFSMFD